MSSVQELWNGSGGVADVVVGSAVRTATADLFVFRPEEDAAGNMEVSVPPAYASSVELLVLWQPRNNPKGGWRGPISVPVDGGTLQMFNIFEFRQDAEGRRLVVDGQIKGDETDLSTIDLSAHPALDQILHPEANAFAVFALHTDQGAAVGTDVSDGYLLESGCNSSGNCCFCQ